MSNTRADLFSDLDDWLNRSDLSSVSTILRVAQSMIDRTVRTRSQEFTVELTPNSDGSVDLPADFQVLRGLDVDGDEKFLSYVTLDTFRKVNRLDGSVRRDYTVEGEKLLFKPGLAAGQAATLSYSRRLPRLVNDADTNWLLTNAYDIYLWACFRTAAVYEQDQALEQVYDNRYREALDELNISENRSRFPAIAITELDPRRRVV